MNKASLFKITPLGGLLLALLAAPPAWPSARNDVVLTADGGRLTEVSPEIQERIQRLVVEELRVDPAAVTASTRFVEDLDGEPLDILEVVMATEKAFDIEISEPEHDRIRTVGDVSRIVQHHLACRAR